MDPDNSTPKFPPNPRLNKEVLHSISSRVQATLSNIGKLRGGCEFCLTKMDKSKPIQCQHQRVIITKTNRAIVHESKMRQKELIKNKIKSNPNKAVSKMERYRLDLEREELLIESGMSGEKGNKGTLESTFKVSQEVSRGRSQKPTEISSKILKQKQQKRQKEQKGDRKRQKIVKTYDRIFSEVMGEEMRQSERKSKMRDQGQEQNSKIKIVHFAQSEDEREGQNEYEQAGLTGFITGEQKGKTFLSKELIEESEQEENLVEVSETQTVIIKIDQSTMTESYFPDTPPAPLHPKPENTIMLHQFKECIQRFYRLVSQGKSVPLLHQYQEKYRQYIRQMEDKFMRCRQNMMELESSVEELGRKMQIGGRNSYSYRESGYNSKRESLEGEPFHALLSSINEQTLHNKGESRSAHRQNQVHDYLYLLMIQSDSLQQLLPQPAGNYFSESQLEDMIE